MTQPASATRPKLSFVVPVKEEEETIEQLFYEIQQVLGDIGISDFEVIYIDDGSRDSTWACMQELARKHPMHCVSIRLRRNYGKAFALVSGFRESRGDVIITMDGDMQDDPKEIPRFLAKLDAGFDLVSGWKQNRQDPLSKTLPSRLFNWVTSRATGIPLHDFNCGFKAYRKEVLESVRLYGELHRYIPVLAHDAGFRIGEIGIHHQAREHGQSKYGWERYVRGLVDLLTVLATTRYLHRPSHLFGGLGLAAGALGAGILGYLAILWFAGAGPRGSRPLFFVGILSTILAVQLISLGVLAELVTRHSPDRSIGDIVAQKQDCRLQLGDDDPARDSQGSRASGWRRLLEPQDGTRGEFDGPA